MNRLIFIRHGETDWNRNLKLQGHADIPLNNFGVEQAEVLKLQIESLNPTSVFSSDLLRAKQTAQIARPQDQVQVTPWLREVSMGLAEGRTRQQAAQDFGESIWEQWQSSSLVALEKAKFPEGESRLQGLERFFQFIRSLPNEGNQLILAFSHGLMIRSFCNWAEGFESAQTNRATPNCCQFEFHLQSTDLSIETHMDLRPRLLEVRHLPNTDI